MFSTGFVYKNDCPFEPWIPVHLIVSGICGLISNRLAKSKIADISNCFLTVWFVAGIHCFFFNEIRLLMNYKLIYT